MLTRNIVGAAAAALTFASVFSLIAINERASRSPTSVLAQRTMLADIRGSGAARRAEAQQKQKRPYIGLPDAGSMGTNKAFANKGDGKGLKSASQLSGFGTDSAFLHKYDGEGQSTKGKMQQLYEWSAGELLKCVL